MKHAVRLAFWFWVGYTLTTKAAPAIQAKVESMNLDSVWESWEEEWL